MEISTVTFQARRPYWSSNQTISRILSPTASCLRAAPMTARRASGWSRYSSVSRSMAWILLPPASLTFLKNPAPVLAPSIPLATIWRRNSGTAKRSRQGSSGQPSAMVPMTWAMVSRPTMSAVRNTADEGRPMVGPNTLSVSETPMPSSFIQWTVETMPNTPMRLATKFGVSLP